LQAEGGVGVLIHAAPPRRDQQHGGEAEARMRGQLRSIQWVREGPLQATRAPRVALDPTGRWIDTPASIRHFYTYCPHAKILGKGPGPCRKVRPRSNNATAPPSSRIPRTRYSYRVTDVRRRAGPVMIIRSCKFPEAVEMAISCEVDPPRSATRMNAAPK
jgi:hypothetical protein